MLLELPPSALEGTRSPPSSPLISSDDEEDPEYQPLSTKTKSIKPAAKKRKSSLSNKDHIALPLPPPPGRARKIIEMKPKPSTSASPIPSSSSTAARDTIEGTKKTSKSTTASRKISRKTAHSLIERRRRGKMNDEFEVLKDMIPACKASEDVGGGREMHKLEILKASVEYIRYLKDCVCQLQGDGEACCAQQEMIGTAQNQEDEHDMDEEEDTDIEMEIEQSTPDHVNPKLTIQSGPGEKDVDMSIDPQLMHFNPNPPPTPRLSPAILPQPSASFMTPVRSPTNPLTITQKHQTSSSFTTSSVGAQPFDERHFSVSPVRSTTSPLTISQKQQTPSPNTTSSVDAQSSDERHFSFSSAGAHSQSFLASPPNDQLNTFTWRASISSQTSPVMAPLPSQENDATVALLMLNGEWPSRGCMGRTGSRDDSAMKGFGDGGRRRRGLSVKDLLSS